jgi:HEAT repeat protein
MVICFVLTFPVALISGITGIYLLSIGLSLLSYLSIYFLLIRDDTLGNNIFRSKKVYIVPMLCFVTASALAYTSDYRIPPKDIPSLIEQMGDCDIGRQQGAARKLRHFGKEPYLIALHHTNPRVRAKAAHFLGLLNDPSVQDVLIKTAEDSDPYVRMYAAFSLGRIGNAKALPTLQALAKDNVDVVRLYADEAIVAMQKRLEQYQYGKNGI